jgi:hypothetical protein
MKGASADIGTSGAPDLMPIRTIPGVTPERRERIGYPKRDDGRNQPKSGLTSLQLHGKTAR